MSLKPFDYEALTIDMSGAMYKNQQYEWNLGPLGEYQFLAMPADMHLLAITIIAAFFASFARVFADGIKKALRVNSLGCTLYSGGVIDHFSGVMIVGIFMVIYVNQVIYKQDDPMEKLRDLIMLMTPEAK